MDGGLDTLRKPSSFSCVSTSDPLPPVEVEGARPESRLTSSPVRYGRVLNVDGRGPDDISGVRRALSHPRDLGAVSDEVAGRGLYVVAASSDAAVSLAASSRS